ncbi:MAG: hypothetical protein DCC65_07905 [Planctomycetota bacterium]|nr:MAG: hypothetical protein DCC65_07905 [Planctomycetota bacterium]
MNSDDNKIRGTGVTKLSTGAFQGYFGGCPHCGESEGPHNVGRAHWLVCREHCVRWWIGENLFAAWRSETPEEWEKTRCWLSGFRMVDPVYGEDSNLGGEADGNGL